MKRLFLAVAILAVLAGAGCPKPVPLDNSPVSLTAEEKKLVEGYRGLRSVYRSILKEKLASLQAQDARAERWAWRLWIAGIGSAVVGALALAIRFVPAVQGWLAAVKITYPALPGMALRVGFYALAAGGVGMLSAHYIAEVFLFLQWALMALAALTAAFLTWEAAAIYYTGKVDVPCDGVKPPCSQCAVDAAVSAVLAEVKTGVTLPKA